MRHRVENSVSLCQQDNGTLAQVTVSASLERVWRVLHSFEEMPYHLSAIKQSRILEKEGPRLLVEQISKSGIPLLPLTFRAVIDVIEERPFLYFKQRSGSFMNLRGYWRVEPSSNGPGTRVQYYLELGLGRGLKSRAVEQQLHRMIRQNIKELAAWIENSGI